jgi:hypothetical protein
MSEPTYTVEIDTKGLEDKVLKAIDAKFEKIEERLTEKKVTKALDETDMVGKSFDYKEGIAKWMREVAGRSFQSASLDSTMDNPLWDKKEKDFLKSFEVTTDRLKRITEYKLNESLVEGIGSLNPDCCIPELWADDVERTHVYPGSVFWGAWFMRWERGLAQGPGDLVHICLVPPMIAASVGCTEPTTSDVTITCVNIDLSHYGCAYYICKNDIVSVMPDLIDELNAALGDCLAVKIDNWYFDRALSCSGGTLNCTIPMSGSMIATAMGSMRAGTYEPVVLIVHPVVMSSLLQDSQFVNAATFGSRDVITGGRVVEYMGIQLLMTPKGTLNIGGGTYRSLLLAKNALAGAYKYGVTIESEYSVQNQKRYVLADIKFGGTCLHADGIWWIRSVDLHAC